MITALTALLVLISLGLVVTVPVALATPGEWENSKATFTKGYFVVNIVLHHNLIKNKNNISKYKISFIKKIHETTTKFNIWSYLKMAIMMKRQMIFLKFKIFIFC